MILYNVTVNIDAEVHDEWLNWMKQKHIPDVLATGCFKENKLCRLLQHDEPGYTYSIQYFAETMAEYDHYRAHYAPKLQKEHTDLFQNKFVAFRTLMEVVQP